MCKNENWHCEKEIKIQSYELLKVGNPGNRNPISEFCRKVHMDLQIQ